MDLARGHLCLLRIACIAVLIMTSSAMVAAQQSDTTRVVRIETRDGNEYVGKILEQTNDQLRLQTEKLGVITLRMIEITSIEPVKISQIRDDGLWFANPQSTRYLWAPNAYGLKKGEGYYQNTWIFFNQVSVGLSDHFSLGAGMIPLFLFAGASTPAWITPKFSIPVREEKFNIGAGGLLGTVIGESESGFGILYGIATLGSRDHNVSLGLGYGYASGEWGSHPAISLSTLLRISSRGYFISENYYLSSGAGSIALLSFGGRAIIKRTGLDFGLFIPLETGARFFAIPWLGFTVPLGKASVAQGG